MEKPCISEWASAMMSYRAIAVNACAGLLRDRDMAEDVVHVVMMTIIHKLTEEGITFSSRVHLRNYLLKAVRNRATDVLKDRTRWVEENEDKLSGTIRGDEDPLQSLITREDQDKNEERLETLTRGIKTLKSAEREVILLRFMRGMKYREISEITGVPITTLKSREDSALRKLRKFIVKSLPAP